MIIDRPTCPASIAQARFHYKKGMSDYMAQFGFVCQNPLVYTPSVLEAVANYLEHRSKKCS